MKTENEWVRCPSCGAEVPSESAYCNKCGARTGAQAHRCASCDAELPPQSAYCSKCGARNELRVRYSLWRVGILTFLSFGLYYYYWMYVSWKHLAEEMPGKEFHPFWHAMSQFAPIYNFVVIYQHFRTIKDAQERERVKSNLVPGLALALSIVLPVILSIGVWILAFALLWALQILSGTPAVAVLGGVVFILMFIGAVAGTSLTLVLWGQRNLNKYWERPGARPARSARTGPGEVIISAVGGLFTALVVIPITFGVLAIISEFGPISSVSEADSFAPIQTPVRYRGTIGSPSEADAYGFMARAGTEYTIVVNPIRLEWDLYDDPLESALVTLWDSDGSTIMRTASGSLPIVIRWTAPSSGPRFVTIESDGTALGDYVLRVDAR